LVALANQNLRRKRLSGAAFDFIATSEKVATAIPINMKRRSFLFASIVAAVSTLPLAVFAADTHVKGDKPAHVSMGQEVKITDYLVPGKTTIIDFTSEYCPPCRAIAPHLVTLHSARKDVAVVSVDINRPGIKGIDWKSPVARQYGLHSIPHFQVYGPDGKLMAEGDAAREKVIGYLQPYLEKS
jgi:thiol-disulfide isomerase/thioredoxin